MVENSINSRGKFVSKMLCPLGKNLHTVTNPVTMIAPGTYIMVRQVPSHTESTQGSMENSEPGLGQGKSVNLGEVVTAQSKEAFTDSPLQRLPLAKR